MRVDGPSPPVDEIFDDRHEITTVFTSASLDPMASSPINSDTVLEVLDLADLHAPLDQFGQGGIDVGDDQLYALS